MKADVLQAASCETLCGNLHLSHRYLEEGQSLKLALW